MHSDRKTLVETLAMPSKGYAVLKINFILFANSEDKMNLGKIMRFAKTKLDRMENNEEDLMDAGCFSFMELVRKRSSSVDSVNSTESRKGTSTRTPRRSFLSRAE